MTELKGTDALDYIRMKHGNYPGFDEGVERAYLDMLIGQAVYDARTEAGLTQAELAEKVGIPETIISEIEDADHEENDSLFILQQIAKVLNKQLEIRIVAKIEKDAELQPTH